MIWIGGAAALVCAGLGTWQWNRYNWRLDFIQQQSTLANQLPIDIGLRSTESKVQLFKATGRWIPEGMVLVGLRNPPGGGVQGGELGYIVLSPFMSSDGRLVLANRGWIPKSLHRNCQGDRVEIAKKVFCKVDRVDIEGVFQKGDNKPLGFIGNSKSNDIQWIWLDEDSIKREILKETQINSSFERDVFRVTKDSGNCLEGKLPMHLDAQSILASPSSYLTPTKHLVYCGTWFSLAAAISILTWRWGRTRPKSFAWKKS